MALSAARTSELANLKEQAQTELDHTREVSLLCDSAEGTVSYSRVGSAKQRRVGEVQRLGAELSLDAFGDGEVLEHRNVPVDLARSTQPDGAGNVAELKDAGESGMSGSVGACAS